MLSNLSKQHPSLGQVADLGDIYDAMTDSFVSLSVLNSWPSPSEVRPVQNLTTELECFSSNIYGEKFSKLKVNAELGPSVLSGMASVGGSGRFLTKTRSSSQERQISWICNIITVHEKLNIKAFTKDDLKSHVNLDVIQSGTSTHIVSVIEWGANNIHRAILSCGIGE